MRNTLTIILFAFSSLAVSQPDRYAVLDTSQAILIMKQCSRWTPAIQNTWIPSKEEIQSLEDNLESVSKLSSYYCCFLGIAVKQPKEYLRQYIGVVIDGKKFIYVNAFPLTEFEDYPPGSKYPDWHKEAFRMCDGGQDYWGVIYDPVTKLFSHLAFNGVA